MHATTRHSSLAPAATRAVGTAALALLPAAGALAHHGMDGAMPQTFGTGFLSGLMHPVIGLDHLAFLAVVALLASVLPAGRRLAGAGAFVAATLTGTLLHLGAVGLPHAELIIALSVLTGGLATLLLRQPRALVLLAGFAFFGIFHGYALGEAIVGAEPTPLVAYVLGFAAVQVVLLGAAIHGLGRLAEGGAARSLAPRLGGGLAAVFGAGLVALSVGA